MISELYVSLNGVNYTILDLENTESIAMKYTFKDTQDISKVFIPFSLGFTFNATPKNLLNLGFFGDTDVVKLSDLRKIKAKIYVNSILNQTGFLKLENISYKNGKPDVIKASFVSSLTNLAKRIGDDTINTLGSKIISWNPKQIKNSIQSIATTSIDYVPLKWFTPLASTKRVWQYDNVNLTALDNIAYDAGTSLASNNLIQDNELRPAISFSTIFELIKKKYDLQIIQPLESQNEYKDMYAWCMGTSLGNNLEKKVIVKTSAFDSQVGFSIDISNTTNKIKVVKPSNIYNSENYFIHKVELSGINYFGVDTSLTLSIYRVGDVSPIVTETKTISATTEFIEVQIPDIFLDGSNTIEYYCFISFTNNITWTNISIRVGLFLSLVADLVVISTPNNNFLDMGGSEIDLIATLPEVKVIDFLTSYLRMFNIAILDVTPDNDDLYFYTPLDIEQNKKTVTYTADISSVDKSVQDDFNYYIFKHADSNFRSNSDYKIGAGQEYGQTSYPEIKPNEAKEYKVETSFTIIPPVLISGTADIITYYGFEAGAPDYLGTGESRFNPNFGELVLFYSHGVASLGREFAIQDNDISGALILGKITNYVKALPYTTDFKSISFSILVFNSIQYPNTLFNRYYLKIIQRYIDQNVMKQEFSLTLSSNEVNDFRLENDIVIGENRFSIIDSSIDVTSGKTKLTLLNY